MKFFFYLLHTIIILLLNRIYSNLQHERQSGATRMWRECNQCATQNTRGWHEWKILILIPTREKTYFHTTTFTIWQVNDYKERHKFILRTTFWKCFDPMPKWVRKLHDKSWMFNGKSYIKKLYTISWLHVDSPVKFHHSYA